MKTDRASLPADQDSISADDAWQVYRTYMVAEAHDPSLRDNALFAFLKADAYAEFAMRLEAE